MLDDTMYTVAGQLSHEQARRYLESRGWTRARSRRSEIGVFHLGEHEAILPMDTALRDYAGAMILLARRVAEAEHRSPERVLADMSAANRDRHRPALTGIGTPGGATLDAATAMLDGISRAFLASACSALQPRAFHPRMSLSDAEAFIGDTRFLTTEVGSFIMIVETPMEVEGARRHFGREASVFFIRSLAHVASAIRTDTEDRVVNPESNEPQVSANLCEAILRMAPANESADLRFEVAWSPLIAPPRDVPPVVSIDRHMYEAVERVARQLRPSESVAASALLCIVKELKGAPGPTGPAEGEVIFTVVQEDGSSLRAKALLDAIQYRVALVAHANAQPVVVLGELHRVRRGYELRKVTAVDHWRHESSD